MNLVGVLLSVIAILNVEEKTYSAAYRTQRRINKTCLIVHSIINYMVWIKVTGTTSNTLKVGSVNLLKTPLAKTPVSV